jgi:RNA-dependent RNA polymerase
VLVYRNPGLHFGDIHVLKATYVKALEDYVGNAKFAVFFPQKGPRSLGDEIAGGDFDGDMYFISRNPKLLEHFKPSEPWVSSSKPSKIYCGRKPSELSEEELEEELFKMFLKARFCKRDVIGMAADCWLGIMDPFLTLGDESAKEKYERKKNILKLIDIYYDALDAPKKGAKVDLPPDLEIKNFPHYMERDPKRDFRSTSILGLIFDTVDSHNAEEPPPSEISKLWYFEDEPVPKSHMDKFTSWYENYRSEMSQAMMETDKVKRNQLTNEVIQRYKQDFYGAAGFEDSNKSLEELYPQALALYNVVYDYAIQEGVAKCTFAWNVAGPVLCKFYLKKTKDKSVVASTSVLKKLLG